MFDSKNGEEINKFNAQKISWIPNQAQVNQLSASIPVVVVVFTTSSNRSSDCGSPSCEVVIAVGVAWVSIQGPSKEMGE
jgi:hypothetical protein